MAKEFITRSVRCTILALSLGFLAVTWPNSSAQGEQSLDQQQKLAELSQKIAGRENKPAEGVFKNIQRLKGIEAARLLRAMNSYSRALGVACTHCHSADQWEKDDKPAKQIAREMIGLMRTINSDLLKNIKNLKSPNPNVTCTTCHRGQLKPEVNLPEIKPSPSSIALGQMGQKKDGLSNKEQELIDVEKARTQAIKQGDTKALDKIYADDFAGVTSGGRAVNKAQLMEVFKGVDPRLTFTTDELRVRMFGETAIVTGRVTGRTQDGEVVSSFTFLHVYVKRDGQWQMVAGQSTNMLRQ